MSRHTSSSSFSNARRSRSEFGIVNKGLPPVTNNARTWRSPGVKISSASTPPGNPSLTAANPPMRERAVLVSTPTRLPKRGKSMIPRPTSVPPARSRFPLTALITSCSQNASDPLPPMFTPVEQYSAAPSAARYTATISRSFSAGICVTAAARSGDHASTNASTSSSPRMCAATRPRSTPPVRTSSFKNAR